MDEVILTAGERARHDAVIAFWDRAAPLKPYLFEDGVTEIAVNVPGEVWLMVNGRWERRNAADIDLTLLETVGLRLANYASKPFDRDNTSLSTHLPSGERIEMTHPPTCPEGVRYLNIRKHAAKSFTHSLLIEQGYYSDTRHEVSLSLDEGARAKLHDYLEDEEKELWDLAQNKQFDQFMEKAVGYYQNILISGATHTGKTSYMRALVELMDSDDRILTIEDTPEMPLPSHPNNNALFYKKMEKSEGATAKEVLHSAMRKTPTRVLLAELRSDEAMQYLSGTLLSGHPGGITTAHSGSPKQAFWRLALLILESKSGQSLSLPTIMQLLHMALNVVVQIRYDKKTGKRSISSIYYDPHYRLSTLG